jgi:hypothetical protein
VPPLASLWGMVASIYIANALQESDRNGESLWGERQGEAVTEIFDRRQRAVMLAGAQGMSGFSRLSSNGAQGTPRPTSAPDSCSHGSSTGR